MVCIASNQRTFWSWSHNSSVNKKNDKKCIRWYNELEELDKFLNSCSYRNSCFIELVYQIQCPCANGLQLSKCCHRSWFRLFFPVLRACCCFLHSLSTEIYTDWLYGHPCTAIPEISSSRKNISNTACVSTLSFRFFWLCFELLSLIYIEIWSKLEAFWRIPIKGRERVGTVIVTC